MPARRPRYVTITLGAAIFLVPLLYLSSPMRPWGGSGNGTTLLQDITYPVERLWTNAIDGVVTSWQRYIALVDAERDNERLRDENRRLRLRMAEHDELARELNESRRATGLAPRLGNDILLATVIGRAGARPFRSIRVDRGSADGVRSGFPVITADGVVGRVLRVGRRHSDIQTITDGDFALDGLLQRNRVRGVLRGIAGDRCRLQLHRQAEVRIGDTVITSGIVGSFPKGLPVGRVIGISYETDNVTQIVTVEPWVSFPSLDSVALLRREDRDIERVRSIGGDAWIDGAVGAPTDAPHPEE